MENLLQKSTEAVSSMISGNVDRVVQKMLDSHGLTMETMKEKGYEIVMEQLPGKIIVKFCRVLDQGSIEWGIK